MQIFYRLSDGSYPKVRFERATKGNCLANFLDMFEIGYGFDDTFTLVLDNVKDETVEWTTELLKGYVTSPNIMRTEGGSSAAGFRIVFEHALTLDGNEHVYFVEDDYAHLPGSRQVLVEGLERAHYVTLYNHPDKYLPASEGGNPFIKDDRAEETKVFVTPSSYWMLTNSTTMTFATHMNVLRDDQDVWNKHIQGTYPQDMQIFLELRAKGRSLVQPIPTMSTHCEPAWASYLHGTGITSWEEVL